LMIHRLEHLVEQRRAALHAAAPQAS